MIHSVFSSGAALKGSVLHIRILLENKGKAQENSWPGDLRIIILSPNSYDVSSSTYLMNYLGMSLSDYNVATGEQQ